MCEVVQLVVLRVIYLTITPPSQIYVVTCSLYRGGNGGSRHCKCLRSPNSKVAFLTSGLCCLPTHRLPSIHQDTIKSINDECQRKCKLKKSTFPSNLQIGYVCNFVKWVVLKSRHIFLKKKERDRKGEQSGYQVSPEEATFLMVMTMVMVVQAKVTAMTQACMSTHPVPDTLLSALYDPLPTPRPPTENH